MIQWLRQLLSNGILLTINYTSTLHHYETFTLPFSGDHKLILEYFNIKNPSLLAGEQSSTSTSPMKLPCSLNLGFIYSALLLSILHRKM